MSEAVSINQQITVQNQLGLHIRASSKLVDLVNRFAAEVLISFNEQTVAANSIMGLMGLGAKHGSVLEFCVNADTRDNAEKYMAAIDELFANKFDEE